MRGVLGDVNAIVEIGSREEGFESDSFDPCEMTNIKNNAFDVLEVVGGIAFRLVGEIGAKELSPLGFAGHEIEKRRLRKSGRTRLVSQTPFFKR